MKLNYTLLLALLAVLYQVLIQFFPDAPISLDLLVTLALYVLAKLGVEIVGIPLRGLLAKRFKKFR